ncbi:hypothetical protein [Paenibacillus ihuae]|uniref:hypothetical protein n=1 Tax=Paenibacillus ihuae TaxID=1232431 RepID=UPI0006D5754D|nr:hypothetical protein [Paenibacillus ihuae]
MNNNSLILISDFKSSPKELNFHVENVYNSLITLNREYPGFDNWYYSKVIPELKKGSRDIIMAYNNQVLSGVSILKKLK